MPHSTSVEKIISLLGEISLILYWCNASFEEAWSHSIVGMVLSKKEEY